MTEPTVPVMGRLMTREDIFARCAQIATDNARLGLSDGRTTETHYLVEGMLALMDLTREDNNS